MLAIQDIQYRSSEPIYYEAWISNGKVVKGKALSLEEALARGLVGGSVYSTSKSAAYNLAKLASGGEEPVHDNPHGTTNGYKPHYHLHGRKNKAHIWYQ